VISVGTWEIIQESQLSANVICLAFSMHNEILTLGLSDGILAFVNPSYDGRWEVAGEMDSSNSPVLAVDWSSCGNYLAVGRCDSAVTIHDSQSIFDNFFSTKG
jgi:WD40 repeat protein